MEPATTDVKQPSEDEIRHGIEATVMAFREHIMQYYKGTCIERVTNSHNIGLIPMQSRSGRYQYQRVANSVRDKHVLALGNTHIGYVEKLPDAITFDLEKLSRSPQLRAVHKGLEKFMGRYLPSIQVKTKGVANNREKDDSNLVLMTFHNVANTRDEVMDSEQQMRAEAMRYYDIALTPNSQWTTSVPATMVWGSTYVEAPSAEELVDREPVDPMEAIHAEEIASRVAEIQAEGRGALRALDELPF